MSCFSSRADFLNESCFLVSLWFFISQSADCRTNMLYSSFFYLFALFRFIRAFDATGTAGRAHATLLLKRFLRGITRWGGGMVCGRFDGRELRYT
jgi:hypothetical protein